MTGRALGGPRRAAAALLALALMSGGCWSRIDVDELAFVSALGFDRTEEGAWRVTAEIVVPRALGGGVNGAGGGPPVRAVWVPSVTGPTPLAAVERLAESVSRELFLSHAVAVIVGADAARAGLMPLLDAMERHRELRRTPALMVARGRAEDVAKSDLRLAAVGGTALRNMARFLETETSAAPFTEVHDFLVSVFRPGDEAMAPLVTLVRSDDLDTPFAGEAAAADPGPVRGDVPQPRLRGAAVFRNDRLAGFLDGRAARGVLWARGRLRRAVMVVPCPPPQAGTFTAVVLGSRSQVTPELRGGPPVYSVRIRASATVAEADCRMDLRNPEVVRQAGEALGREVVREVRAALDALQGMGVDALGFGAKLRRRDPGRWRELEPAWPQTFSRLRVDVEARVGLVRTERTFRLPPPR